MSRVGNMRRSFVVAAVMLAAALVSVAFPLVAMASNGGVHGS